jgi:hypothetical protein
VLLKQLMRPCAGVKKKALSAPASVVVLEHKDAAGQPQISDSQRQLLNREFRDLLPSLFLDMFHSVPKPALLPTL